MYGSTMPIFERLWNLLSDDSKKKSKVHLQNVQRNQNPLDVWEIVNEIGDGAFGKVYKVMILFTDASIVGLLSCFLEFVVVYTASSMVLRVNLTCIVDIHCPQNLHVLFF